MFHLTTLATLPPGVFYELLATAQDVRRYPPAYRNACIGRSLALFSYGTAFHLRLPMEVAFKALGGRLQSFGRGDVGERWSASSSDLAAMLAASVDGIALIAPTEVVQAFAEVSTVPVLALCAGQHSPIDAIAMLYTVQRSRGKLAGQRIAVIGDGSSVANGTLLAGAIAGMTVAIAHPRGFAPDSEVTTIARHLAAQTGGAVLVTEDPAEAITDADVVVVEPWSSRGGGRDPEGRIPHFSGFSVTSEMMERARPGAMVLHQGPVRCPDEMSVELADAHRDCSRDWATNRVHMCKAVLLHALGRQA